METIADDLSESQWWIVEISQTPGNEPARQIYEGEAIPTFDQIIGTLNQMIEHESDSETSIESAKLATRLSELRYSLMGCHESIVKYLHDGIEAHRKSYRGMKRNASRQLHEILTRAEGLSEEYHRILEWIGKEAFIYHRIAEEALAIRSGNKWNRARHLLKSEAVPLADKAIRILEAVGQNEQKALESEANFLLLVGKVSLVGVAGLMILMGGLSRFLSLRTAEEITEPLAVLADGTQRLATGRLARDLDVTRDDEIGELTKSFNRMRYSIEEREAAIQDREENLRAVVDSVIDPIITIDAYGHILTFNPAAERTFGYEASEVIGRNVKVLVPSPYREEHDKYIRRFLETGVKKIIGIGRTVSGLRKDGSTFPLDLSVTDYTHGGETRFVGIARDISEQVESRESLEAFSKEIANQGENLRAILDSVVDPIITIDSEARIQSFNPAAEKIFGYETIEVLGKNVKMLMPSPYREEHDDYIRHFLETGDKKIIGIGRTVVGLRKDGSTFPLELSVGRIIPMEVGSDLLESRETFPNRFSSREKLELYSKELERSNQDLQDFAVIASHDLQEPLRKIESFGERLSKVCDGKIGEDGQGYLERMLSSTRRMRTLIHDMLTLSRVDSRAQPFLQIDLNEVVQEAIDNLRQGIVETKAEITVEHLPEIEADRIQMVQLFQNLLGNAIKYRRPEVSPKIEIRARTFETSKSEFLEETVCEIVVRDNGIGFDSQHSDKIFTIFERLHGNEQYTGTGVGLAVCKKVVQRHGGSIRADGEKGVGSTFIVTLPVSHEKDAKSIEVGA